MKERPILFNGPMVRAILSGTKTQTRRVVKPQQPLPGDGFICHHAGGDEWFYQAGNIQWQLFRCPYGQPGDQLWVRETFQIESEYQSDCGREFDSVGGPLGDFKASDWNLIYEATTSADGPWRPSIHMPRWASRINLEITSVRVERLKEITEEDAKAEGVEPVEIDFATDRDGAPIPPDYRLGFSDLWSLLYVEKPGSDWNANPWVWVIEFRRVP